MHALARHPARNCDQLRVDIHASKVADIVRGKLLAVLQGAGSLGQLRAADADPGRFKRETFNSAG
jgi:hypothetical protein